MAAFGTQFVAPTGGAPVSRVSTTTAVYKLPQPPNNEPLDNRPIFWDSATHAAGNNGLAKVLADQVPLPAGLPGVQQLGKGVLVSLLTASKNGQYAYRCFFRYNPNQFDYSYEFDMSAIGATPPTNQSSAQIRGLALNATLSIELFFERIQDLWVGNALPSGRGQGGGPGKVGVLWDIWALERLAGVTGQSTGQDPNGPPLTAPIAIWLGGVGNKNAFHMYGLITGLDVSVSQFDKNMVPSVATAQLQFVRILNPASEITNLDPKALTASASPTNQASGPKRAG